MSAQTYSASLNESLSASFDPASAPRVSSSKNFVQLTLALRRRAMRAQWDEVALQARRWLQVLGAADAAVVLDVESWLNGSRRAVRC